MGVDVCLCVRVFVQNRIHVAFERLERASHGTDAHTCIGAHTRTHPYAQYVGV